MTPAEALRFIQALVRAAPSRMDSDQLSRFLFTLQELTAEGLGERRKGAPRGRIVGVIRPRRSAGPRASARLVDKRPSTGAREAEPNGPRA
jgi:hypothetical protein